MAPPEGAPQIFPYLLISGSRTISSPAVFSTALAHLPAKIRRVYHGGAKGVDTGLSHWLVREEGAQQEVFIPDWEKFGRVAGKVRNTQMLAAFLADIQQLPFAVPHFFAIWDGQSKGTAHMLAQAAAHHWASWQVLLVLPTGLRLISSIAAAKLDPIISPCLQS